MKNTITKLRQKSKTISKTIIGLGLILGLTIGCGCVGNMTPNVNTLTPATRITISEENFVTTNGERGQLTVQVEPTNHTDNDVLWFSSDSNIFKINEDGSYLAPRYG